MKRNRFVLVFPFSMILFTAACHETSTSVDEISEILSSSSSLILSSSSSVILSSSSITSLVQSSSSSALVLSSSSNIVLSSSSVVTISSSSILLSSSSSATDSITYGSLIDNRDGHVYKTVVIGGQTWMAENLSYEPSSQGASWCPDNLCDTYGRLYDWATATAGISLIDAYQIVQGICPAGWHIPTDDEWRELELYMGMKLGRSDSVGWRGTDQGTRMKANSSLWEINTGANTNGFSALPAGFAALSVDFVDDLRFTTGYLAHFWSASEISVTMAYDRVLSTSESGVYRSPAEKTEGKSLRCLEDRVVLPD